MALLAIAVQGARRDSFPSGMLRDMSSGNRVYLLRDGEDVKPEDAVRTIGPAPLDRLGTVEEYDDWRTRRRTRRQAP